MQDFETDCLIVGAGPGGLIAATYLARFHRPPLVIDAGESRAAWIPTSHNTPGFPGGVSGRDLLVLLREQAESFGVRIVRGRVARLERTADGAFAAVGEGMRVRARRVILATGVDDAVPGFDAVARGIRSARIRLCPICDGYEATGHRIGVIGPADRAFREARFLKTYTRDLTILRLAEHPDPCREDEERCSSEGFAIEGRCVTGIEPDDDGVTVRLEGGDDLRFDDLYVAMGGRPRADLARSLGAEVAADGFLVTDPHQRTTVPGLYAVGDIVHELNQIAVAAGHAAIAATDIHNELTSEDRGERRPTSGDNTG